MLFSHVSLPQLVAHLYLRALGSLFVTCHDYQEYSGGILTRQGLLNYLPLVFCNNFQAEKKINIALTVDILAADIVGIWLWVHL
jgi:hypothetical protein